MKGFTLIELMIVVAVVGILTMVAYPSYRDSIIRGQLTDGTNGLSQMRAQMERYYQDNRTYASTGTFVTPCAVTDATTRTFGNFVVSCSGTPDATGFVLQAVGSGPSSGFTFTIDQQEAKTTAVSNVSGWNSCTGKWLTRKGATC
jgi:type IV pilus assembly protein PilE